MIKKLLIPLALIQGSLIADATLAPSRLQVKDGYNMYLEGQFLWWLSQNDNLPFCQDGPTSTDFNNTFNGHFKRMNTNFTPGGRLTFGGLMPYDNWDIRFTWTYFVQDSAARTSQQAYYIGNTFGLSNIASYVKAKYDLSLNMLDAILTRPSWMGERFSISPYFGARGTWLSQLFKTRAGLMDASTPMDIYNRSRSDFRGAGILAGMGLRYELKGGWCIEGNFLSSGIYGKFVNYFSGYIKPKSDASFTQEQRLVFSRDPHQSVLFDVEYRLGFGYNKFISQGRYHLGGGLAWEQIIFLNGNRLPLWTTNLSKNTVANGVAIGNPSNLLNMQGITFRFVFGF